ncbi:MAG: hypothetical protein JW776_10670 [Candidatus Lokiarchaeota archaeon]|nr:hypothetical protein [Candidatus Lokiarchaeota archaeon]
MNKKIQIKSIYGNHFVVEKIETENPDLTDEFYHVIFDTQGFVMTKEELKKLQNFFNEIDLE